MRCNPCGEGAVQPSRGISNDYPELEEVKKWLPNCARNANNPIPVESAITMIKLNAPRRSQSMTLSNPLKSQKEKEHLSALRDGGLGAGWQICSAVHAIQSGELAVTVCCERSIKPSVSGS
jgi:hypothetical protein